jgi:hypothetical protein
VELNDTAHVLREASNRIFCKLGKSDEEILKMLQEVISKPSVLIQLKHS